MIEATPTDLPDVLLLAPTVHGDHRGFFFESWSDRDFSAATGMSTRFVQDNHSRSVAGALRGLHYQRPPHPQGKLVRVTAGAVFDVAVDIRGSSGTFGRWVGVELSAENKLQVWIPPGFAHGFLALADAEVLYKTTDYYDAPGERSLRWNDPAIGITWPVDPDGVTLSPKDERAPLLADADVFD